MDHVNNQHGEKTEWVQEGHTYTWQQPTAIYRVLRPAQQVENHD